MTSPDPDERRKVAFLSAPRSYPEGTEAVAVVETHHAWVFLTDQYAYKMKKPFRHRRGDHSSLERRRFLCEEECRLNQALAPNTYLGVVPIRADDDGRIEFGGGPRVVEWLVKMRRLPAEQMLDVAAPAGRATAADIDQLMRKLLRFYRAAEACSIGSSRYSARLSQEIAGCRDELSRTGSAFSGTVAEEVAQALQAYVDDHADLLDRRQADGWVREAHGDLRPEHVCLGANGEPEIIDRLEFDPNLRCLDRVEELAYFGMECRAIGQPWIENACREWYDARGGDPVPVHLWQFYAARRALVRAVLAAWHVIDAADVERWTRRGRAYLALARDYLSGTAIT